MTVIRKLKILAHQTTTPIAWSHTLVFSVVPETRNLLRDTQNTPTKLQKFISQLVLLGIQPVISSSSARSTNNWAIGSHKTFKTTVMRRIIRVLSMFEKVFFWNDYSLPPTVLLDIRQIINSFSHFRKHCWYYHRHRICSRIRRKVAVRFQCFNILLPPLHSC